MATVTKPMALDETLKATNAALAQLQTLTEKQNTALANIKTEISKQNGKYIVEFASTDIVGLHNGLYRGECLYDKINDVPGVFSSLADLHTAVNSGDFTNIYVGDYIDTKMTGSYTWTASDGTESTVSWTDEKVRMVVAGIDYYKGRGSSEMTAHHLVLVPEDCFKNTSPMNSSHTTSGGYSGSQMHTTVLPAYATAMNTALGGYLKDFNTLLSNGISTSVISTGYAGYTGASNNWGWVTTKSRLLSEPMVYGGRVWSSSGYDIGEANQILPYFALRPDKLVAHSGYKSTSRCYWWLSAVAGSAYFAFVSYNGFAYDYDAGVSFGVRPLYLFG